MNPSGVAVNSSWVGAEYNFASPLPPLAYIATAVLALLVYYSLRGFKHNVPILNPKSSLEFTVTRAKKEFVTGAIKMLNDWFAGNPDKPVRLNADFGEVTVLPPHMTNEIRNDKRLSFSRWTLSTFHGNLPGFDGFREGGRDSHIVQDVIMKDLTKYLNKVTEPLAAETAMAIPELLSDDADWHAVPLKDTMLKLVARISSRVFLGEKLCRNAEWLKITQDYTIDAFLAAEELRMWPAAVRPIVNWFLPRCRRLREQVKEAHRIIRPVLEERRQMKIRCREQGEQQDGIDDAIEWFEKAANGKAYDPVAAQLILSVAAIHTTTDLTCQTLTKLAQHPEILGPLREEIVDVLQRHGWKKVSLYNMKLLDSVIKESQRMKPIGTVSMRRVASEDVKLSDGTVIPKNKTVAVSAHKMWDEGVYENPNTWDGYRFQKMRDDPEKQNIAQLVTTGPENLSFGHGKHACPGRFFAANEVKVVLIHLLLKYDWKLPENTVPKARQSGFSMGADPTLRMMFRRRQEEMEI